jgi:CheY-like chemotaxis protein
VTGQQLSGEQPAGEQANGEQATGEHATGQEPTAEQATAEQATGHQRTGQESNGERLTILVADDEQDIRELVAYRLSRSGYHVLEACDGEEALRMAADKVPDMAVLDVMMPRLDGFELTQRLRETPATRQLPILLMSASVQDADISRGFAAGADDYLTKPFTPNELLDRVRAMLARR